MSKNKFLAMVLLLPFLVACQTTEQQVFVTFEAPSVPDAQPMTMYDYQWRIYTIDDLRKLVADLEKRPDRNFALYALTPKGYQALAHNMVEVERYIDEQRQIIVYLKQTNERRAEYGKLPE